MLLQSLRMQQLSLTCRPMSFLRTQGWVVCQQHTRDGKW